MKVIDLTHKLQEQISVYPNTPTPSIQITSHHEEDGFQETCLSFYSHTGTHIDAPRHVLPKGKTLDEFPLSNFMGKAIVIDCQDLKKEIPFSIIEKEPLYKEADFILFHTGWDAYFQSNTYFNDYPILSLELTKYLKDTNIKGIGFDHIGADEMNDETLPHHHLLLAKEKLIIENLTHLNQLPKHTLFTFMAIPLHYHQADGAPVRAFALLDEKEKFI